MKRLNSYRVEAAWNLGQWDILQEHLSMVVSYLLTKSVRFSSIHVGDARKQELECEFRQAAPNCKTQG